MDIWRTRAACLGADPNLFIPVHQAETPAKRARRLKLAFAYCQRCPVTAECLDDAMIHCDDGVRGGQFVTVEDLAKRKRRIKSVTHA